LDRRDAESAQRQGHHYDDEALLQRSSYQAFQHADFKPTGINVVSCIRTNARNRENPRGGR
jgi:hypothetical protein